MNEPTNEPTQLRTQIQDRIKDHFEALYGKTAGADAWRALAARLQPLLPNRPAPPSSAHARVGDAILITYGDQVQAPGQAPLQVLAEFCRAHLQDVVSAIHILPFYPYTSDDGFSVVDYRMVDPALGHWDDVRALGWHFDLMFDAVVNHVSASSVYFQGFLRDEPAYRDFIVIAPEGTDVSKVIRPRTHPLLTRFDTAAGPKWVWTTFSTDQVDLNFANPAVLLEILDVLLFYVAQGARFIRLDAIAFLWKDPNTTSLHLPQTHRVIQLMRSVLDLVAPEVLLITETNVPHVDNLSYFGDGRNEAQMVYNFALPPLVVHTFRNGDAATLTTWAQSLQLPSEQVTFFNFLASHDGIGLNPARGILSDAEIAALVEGTLARGGFINYKTNVDGSRSPYEMNINYLDAIQPAGEPDAWLAARAVAAHAIMLALVGVPGIYFHSLFGSRGWAEGVQLQGHNRAINRQKLPRAVVEQALAQPDSLRSSVFAGISQLLRVRAQHAAFDPYGVQQVLDWGPNLFAVLRGDGDTRVLCLVNVTHVSQPLPADWQRTLGSTQAARDLVTDQPFIATSLQPYQVVWAVAAAR